MQNGSEMEETPPKIIDKALRMMQKMGYKSGAGLGKNEQGNPEVVNIKTQLGKRGFGLTLNQLNPSNEIWDFSKDEVVVEEKVSWLHNFTSATEFFCNIDWIKEGCPKKCIDDEIHFCDKTVLDQVIQAKNIFDVLNMDELYQARSKANPFETIKSVFFMNRAALKMANIDAATDFIFTKIDENVFHKDHKGPYYFADVCAGPGGFSEYVLWRKKWLFKGFGLTLKNEHDFNITESACSPVTFQAFYGAHEDGNVCDPDNLIDFKEKVLFETDGDGVHFMMSDGGFSVEGNENIQEILSKNIYICQCLLALDIVRSHGHFVTKIFDIFTPFSVGLIYLMYHCFEKVAIFKPNSSRPANSERYFICCNLKRKCSIQNIREYLWNIVNRLWLIKDDSQLDIVEIVPLDVIKSDERFFNYIYESNNSLAKRQAMGLEKLATFCRNPVLIDQRQVELRKCCLKYWNVPDKPKPPLQQQASVTDWVQTLIDKPEILLVQPREVSKMENLSVTVADLEDWSYCLLNSSKTSNKCNLYASIGMSKVYRLQRNKWFKMKNLQLPTGTLLYGEFVKEIISAKNETGESFKYSLHVIDSLRLGETSLADLRFHERMHLIQIFCKAVNKEYEPNKVRIRPKTMNRLVSFNENPLKFNHEKSLYISSLPQLNWKSTSENFYVNSVLLLKMNEYQSFQSTYVLRVQIFLKMLNEETSLLSINDLQKFVKEKL